MSGSGLDRMFAGMNFKGGGEASRKKESGAQRKERLGLGGSSSGTPIKSATRKATFKTPGA